MTLAVLFWAVAFGTCAFLCLRTFIDGTYPVSVTVTAGLFGSWHKDYLVSREEDPVKFWIGFGFLLAFTVGAGLVVSSQLLGWPKSLVLDWLADPQPWSSGWS